MAWCLTKDAEQRFLEGLRSGEINPEKLINMTSEERRAHLGKFVGEWNAKFVNTEFESKLLLKNQQRGLIRWAERASGLKEPAKTDLIAKINKLDRALSPENEKQFLADIVERRLGTQISQAEAQVITQFTDRINSLFDKTKDKHQQSNRAYWEARQGLQSYLREITPDFTPTTRFERAQVGTADTVAVARAVKTGLDNSALGRQGRVYFGTKEWNQAAKNSFSYAKSQSALDSLEVDIMSSPYADVLMKNKKELGLTLLGEKLTAKEEQFASKVLSKIPGLKQSERSYVGFLNELRFKRFVNIIDQAKQAGNDITGNTRAVKELAEVIGSATGRGRLGRFEPAAGSLSTLLFSPRWYASRFQVLTDPFTKSGLARKEAAKNIMRLAGTQAAVLGLAHMAGAQTETDPRSSDFLKSIIKSGEASGLLSLPASFFGAGVNTYNGKTRFETSGAVPAFITAIVRTVQGLRGKPAVKSSTTGKISELNTGKFGSQTILDIWGDFLTNRASPVAGVLRDLGKGEDFSGNPVKLRANPDFAKYLFNQLIEPLFVSDVLGAFTDSSGGIFDTSKKK